MKNSVRILLAILITLIAVNPALADGIIIIDPPPTPPPDWSVWLTIRYHRVTIKIDNQVASTKVDQVFRNDNEVPAEGTYIFPLPPGAVVERFIMWVDGSPIEGEILPADEARHIYENHVRKHQDPALLEYIGRDTVRARIFPIPPHEERRIQLEYHQILPLESDMLAYRYPLDTERFSAQPLEQVSIYAELHTQDELRTIYSPSHQDDIIINRLGSNEATVSYEHTHLLPDRDFELYVGMSTDSVGMNMLTYHPSTEDGFFLLMLSPAIETSTSKILPKDIVLVLDTSGSMEGDKLTQAKEALRYVLRHLNPEDRFNIVTFSSNVRPYAEALQASSQADKAADWVADVEAMGGTNIYLALSEALLQATPERTTVIIFLTDGLPTEGIIEEKVLLDALQQETLESVRIFPFGVGYDVNTVLLDQIAENHKGRSDYIEPNEYDGSWSQIDEQISKFYARIQSPVLTDITLDFSGITSGGISSEGVQVYDLYPHALPDLYAGTQLIITGRYTGSGPSTIGLKGKTQDGHQTYTYEGGFVTEGGASFIPRLWAARKIGYLLTQIRLHGEDEEWVEAVVALSQRYGIITPYTSFLIQEDMLSAEGRERAAEEFMASPRPDASGMEAVQEAKARLGLGGAGAPPPAAEFNQPFDSEEGETQQPTRYVRYVGDKTFLCQMQTCTDSTYIPDQMTPEEIVFDSSAYWNMVERHPQWNAYFALANETIFVAPDGQVYRFQLGDPEMWGTSPQATSQAQLPTPLETSEASEATNTPPPQSRPTTETLPDSSGSHNGVCGGAAALAIAGMVIGLQGQRQTRRRNEHDHQQLPH